MPDEIPAAEFEARLPHLPGEIFDVDPARKDRRLSIDVDIVTQVKPEELIAVLERVRVAPN
ncbi:MAG: hypothetical protein ACYDH9_24920 [Limisphaerales bacterium]